MKPATPDSNPEPQTWWSRLPAPPWTIGRCLIAAVVAGVMAMLALPAMVATAVNPLLLGSLGVTPGGPLYGPLNSVVEKALGLVIVLIVMLLLLRPIGSRVLSIRIQPVGRIVVVGVLGAVVLNVVVALWSRLAGDNAEGNAQLKAFGAGQGAATDLALVVAIVVLAPVFEELLFRGMLYLPLRTALGRFGRGVAVAVAGLLSAFAFAGIHLDPTQTQMFPLYVFYGLVTVAAYELTGSLLGPVILHASSNAWAFATPSAHALVGTQTQLTAVAGIGVAVVLAWLCGLALDALGGSKR